MPTVNQSSVMSVPRPPTTRAELAVVVAVVKEVELELELEMEDMGGQPPLPPSSPARLVVAVAAVVGVTAAPAPPDTVSAPLEAMAAAIVFAMPADFPLEETRSVNVFSRAAKDCSLWCMVEQEEERRDADGFETGGDGSRGRRCCDIVVGAWRTVLVPPTSWYRRVLVSSVVVVFVVLFIMVVFMVMAAVAEAGGGGGSGGAGKTFETGAGGAGIACACIGGCDRVSTGIGCGCGCGVDTCERRPWMVGFDGTMFPGMLIGTICCDG